MVVVREIRVKKTTIDKRNTRKSKILQFRFISMILASLDKKRKNFGFQIGNLKRRTISEIEEINFSLRRFHILSPTVQFRKNHNPEKIVTTFLKFHWKFKPKRNLGKFR